MYTRKYGWGWLAAPSSVCRLEFLQKFLSSVFLQPFSCPFTPSIYPIPYFSILQVVSLWKRIVLRGLAGCLIFFPVSYCLLNPTRDKEETKNTFQFRIFFLSFHNSWFGVRSVVRAGNSAADKKTSISLARHETSAGTNHGRVCREYSKVNKHRILFTVSSRSVSVVMLIWGLHDCYNSCCNVLYKYNDVSEDSTASITMVYSLKRRRSRSTLLWYIRQGTVIIPYRRFGTTYPSNLQGSRNPRRKPVTLWPTIWSTWHWVKIIKKDSNKKSKRKLRLNTVLTLEFT